MAGTKLEVVDLASDSGRETSHARCQNADEQLNARIEKASKTELRGAIRPLCKNNPEAAKALLTLLPRLLGLQSENIRRATQR